jgi:hypothetical protein
MLPIFSTLGSSEARYQILKNVSIAESMPILIDLGINNLSNLNPLEEFSRSLASRAQGVRNSVVLYVDHDIYNGGGFKIYDGLLYSLIPKELIIKKPLLGSDSGDESGYAMYKVISLGYNLGEMGPLLASAHAYWEGGLLWLVVAGLLTGLFWNFLFQKLSYLPTELKTILILCIAASFLVDGFISMLTPIYSILNTLIRTIIPISTIYFIFKFIFKKKTFD